MAASPLCTVSAVMPSCSSRRARYAAMSGSSSTTSTRKASAGAGGRATATASLIGDLDFRKEIPVAGDGRLEQRAIAAARAVLDILADVGNLREAVRVADAFHAV